MVITLSIPIKTQQHRSTKRNREMKKKNTNKKTPHILLILQWMMKHNRIFSCNNLLRVFFLSSQHICSPVTALSSLNASECYRDFDITIILMMIAIAGVRSSYFVSPFPRAFHPIPLNFFVFSLHPCAQQQFYVCVINAVYNV